MEWSDYIQAVLAMVFVLGLIGVLVVLLRRFGLSTPTPTLGHRNKRVRIVEVTGIDARRRLVLVRHNDREHLILLGMNGETLIDSQPAEGPLHIEDSQSGNFLTVLNQIIGKNRPNQIRDNTE